MIDQIARTPGPLDALRDGHARAREHVWKLAGAPSRLTIDLDATLIGSHAEKEGATGNFKGSYGFHALLAYGNQTGEELGGELRPGNAGANTAADQIAVAPTWRTTSENNKDTGLRNLPFRDFEHNRVWLALVLIAHGLSLAPNARCSLESSPAPNRNACATGLLHIAARLAFHARGAHLRHHHNPRRSRQLTSHGLMHHRTIQASTVAWTVSCALGARRCATHGAEGRSAQHHDHDGAPGCRACRPLAESVGPRSQPRPTQLTRWS